VFAGHWELRGYGLWVVERAGELIGRIGLLNPEGWPGLEVGWLLGRHAWGHGYATEAARASVEYAWRELGAQELISLIAPDNTPSQRVAQRLGMRPGEDYDLRGTPVVIHHLDR
jgi:RimJ/RimL family protein N-acetyltransferase